MNSEDSVNANFPVTWRYPEDEALFWTQDQLHYPDPVTPLEFSLIEYGVDAGLTSAARAYDIPLTIHDRHINSYLYLAVESHLLSKAEAEATSARSTQKLHDAMATLLATWERTWQPEIKDHLAWWDDFDYTTATLPVLRDRFVETLTRWQQIWRLHFLLLVPSQLAMSEFADLYTDLFEDAEPFEPYELLGGFSSNTVESCQQLWSISRRVLELPKMVDLFMSDVGPELVLTLKTSSDGQDILALLEQYLRSHGQRADKLSLHHRYWVEDPTPVINNLRNYLREPERDLAAELRKLATARDSEVVRLLARLQSFPSAVRANVEFLLQAAQAGAFLAEEHGYWIDYRASYQVRRLLLAIGRQLQEAGALSDIDDIFYLHLDELEALLSPSPAQPLGQAVYSAQIAERRAEADRFAHVRPPEFLGTQPSGLPSELGHRDPITEMFRKIDGDVSASVEDDRLIEGTAGSPGMVEGPVCVLYDLAEAGKVRPGDILVADTTAPPWTPLFATVGGLVTNSGGILSHSAVVAREYGIPAVVGAGAATSRLTDGQRVEVDGNRGTVRILD